LRNAVARDSLVAAHYAGFNLASAHIVRLSGPREAYVSYRLNGRIYWTNRKLKLAAGEKIITDGTNEARTRCGNRLAFEAQAPISPAQPALRIFDDIAPSPDPITPGMPQYVPKNFAVSAPGGSTLPPAGSGTTLPFLIPVGGSGSPSLFPSTPNSSSGPSYPSGPSGLNGPSGPSGPGGPSGPPGPPTPPAVVTPEPNTGLLALTGFGAVLFLGLLRRKQAKAQ
jgi:hypothetical protein